MTKQPSNIRIIKQFIKLVIIEHCDLKFYFIVILVNKAVDNWSIPSLLNTINSIYDAFVGTNALQ